MNLANQLTLMRVAMAIAVFVALLRREPAAHWAALGLFIAAIVTDWVDGRVARRMKKVSAFGKVADPIADKILVLGTLLALLHSHKLGIPLWGVFLILIRELAMGGLRILASASGKVLAADRLGKWKMGVESASVLAMIVVFSAQGTWGVSAWVLALPYYLTVLCVIASWGSAYSYYRKSRSMLQSSWS